MKLDKLSVNTIFTFAKVQACRDQVGTNVSKLSNKISTNAWNCVELFGKIGFIVVLLQLYLLEIENLGKISVKKIIFTPQDNTLRLQKNELLTHALMHIHI